MQQLQKAHNPSGTLLSCWCVLHPCRVVLWDCRRVAGCYWQQAVRADGYVRPRTDLRRQPVLLRSRHNPLRQRLLSERTYLLRRDVPSSRQRRMRR
jgi:hypothetical protein